MRGSEGHLDPPNLKSSMTACSYIRDGKTDLSLRYWPSYRYGSKPQVLPHTDLAMLGDIFRVVAIGLRVLLTASR